MLQPRTNQGLGWRPDLPDIRDQKFRYGAAAVTKPEIKAPPVRAASRGFREQPIFDQRQIGSCTGQSTSRMFAQVRRVSPRSPLFVYYEARRIIGETDVDNGAYIRDAVKVCNTLGVPRDDLWPDVDENVFVDPSDKADRDASKRKIFSYHRLNSTEEMLACIAAGFPFVIGITCFDGMFSDMSYNTGLIPLPKEGERPQGGHAIEIGAYDLDFKSSADAALMRGAGVPEEDIPTGAFTLANSWSTQWGSNGYGFIDVRYLGDRNLSDDVWTIRLK